MVSEQAGTPAAEGDAESPRRPRYPTGFAAEEQGQDAAPAPARAQAAPAPAPAATAPAAPTAREGLPKVQPFTLSVSDLEQVATGSGLQWVNSDAGKVAAVQAAIAAEPKPVHVPRERPPVVVIDEGPLVLVETRKDLSQVTLPFEAGAPR